MCKSELQRDFLIILCTMKPFVFPGAAHNRQYGNLLASLDSQEVYAKRLPKAGLHSHVISHFF